MNSDPQKLTLEKMEVQKKLEEIKTYFQESRELNAHFKDTLTQMNARCTAVELMVSNMQLLIHGDSNSPIKYVRDGVNRRLEDVEKRANDEDESLKKKKDNLVAIGTASIGLAISAFLIWLGKIILGVIHR